LIGESAQAFGGSLVSAGRMTSLLDAWVDMVPISFEHSHRAQDWAGDIRRIEAGGKAAYVITSADSGAGNRLKPGLADQLHSMELLVGSWAERTATVAKQENVDAIHAYGAYSTQAFIGAHAAALIGKPLILTFCGQDLERKIFGHEHALIRQAIDNAALISCKSEKAAAILRRLFKPGAEVRIIRNHVCETYFDPSATIERWGSDPIIGCFGEFRRIVGLDVLLRAYARLLETRQITLALAGPIVAAETEFFNRQLEALPANARVWRMGRVPHRKMLAVYRACNLVIAPSYADACPNKLLEAMLAGVPIVATSTGGIPELVTDQEHALLVEPGDDEGLARAIARLLDDPDLAGTLASHARSRVSTHFTRERQQHAWISAYQSIGLCT
jgi:glycosyltransferase involved in cell wall biosynthesis